MTARIVSLIVKPSADGRWGWQWSVATAPADAHGLAVEVAYGWRLTRRSALRVGRRHARRLSRATHTEET